jgi:hypothetical protein
MSQSKHSRRKVPMTRSQMPFASGQRGAVLTTRNPKLPMELSSSMQKMLSRSWIRY